MSWIQAIFDFLHQFWPLRIVNSYQKGVRFKLGQDTEELGTGWYFFIPFFWSIEVVHTVPDVMDLGVHSITTRDDVTVTFSANVAYEIVDARLMYTKVQDFSLSLARLAEGHLATKIRDLDYRELIDTQKKLEESLERTLTTKAKGWGVLISDVWITDLVKTKQYRLFGQAAF